MPELPEVESVRVGLEQLVVGRTIKSATVLWDNIIKDPAVETFKLQLENEEIQAVMRRGKFLLFILTNSVLISHLRMEGKFRVEDKETDLSKHTHVIFELDNGKELRYLDVRKFGKMSLVKKSEVDSHPSLNSLGPEPIAEELDAKEMQAYLENRKRSIKSCLLDQKMVVGLGNIYADEVLFDAKIHPKREGRTLTIEEIKELRVSIIKIMQKAVQLGGTTIRTYANAYGLEGTYQNELLVYGKKGEACVRCQTPISKMKVSQRGTHYCPNCQKVTE